MRTFKVSNDPKFAEKLESIVGLYLNPLHLADLIAAANQCLQRRVDVCALLAERGEVMSLAIGLTMKSQKRFESSLRRKVLATQTRVSSRLSKRSPFRGVFLA